MAGVHTLKSGVITNRDSSPRVINNPAAAAGTLKGFVGTLETAAPDEDSIGSTYRMASLPSNAVMHSLRVFSDDMGSTAAAVNIGIYQTIENGGAVVDADFFVAALDLKGGALNGTEILHTAGFYGIEEAEKPLWQALGLAADPKINYDIVATATGAVDTAGSFCLKGIYSI